MRVRRASERGHLDHGWLDTYHTFSFGSYHDPRHMGFRDLRVINEDRVAPSRGFGPHPHRDMEIITYVLAGAVEHRDSMGNSFVVPAGDVQRMTAGTGVVHSEQNPSDTEDLHLLQIWILPEKGDLEPGYEQRSFDPQEKRGRLRLLASRDGRDGSVRVNQDVSLYGALLSPDEEVAHAARAGRFVWLQVARGKVAVGGQVLEAGDGASFGSGELTVRGQEDAEILLFDLA